MICECSFTVTIDGQPLDMSVAVPVSSERAARDWAGFFKAFAEFIAILAPIIGPLFLAKKE